MLSGRTEKGKKRQRERERTESVKWTGVDCSALVCYLWGPQRDCGSSAREPQLPPQDAREEGPRHVSLGHSLFLISLSLSFSALRFPLYFSSLFLSRALWNVTWHKECREPSHVFFSRRNSVHVVQDRTFICKKQKLRGMPLQENNQPQGHVIWLLHRNSLFSYNSMC